MAPKWKHLRFDTSVVACPEAYYKSNLAGFLLCSGSLLPAEGGQQQCGTQPPLLAVCFKAQGAVPLGILDFQARWRHEKVARKASAAALRAEIAVPGAF